MKFKKFAYIILFLVILCVFISLYNIMNIQEANYASYIENFDRVLSWEQSSYNVKINSIVKTEKNNRKETKKYDMDINYYIDKKENKGELDFDLTLNKVDVNDVQKLKIFFDKDNQYISKDYLNRFLEKNDFDKVITKDFGKFKFESHYKSLYIPSIVRFMLINDFIIKPSKNLKRFFRRIAISNSTIDLKFKKKNGVYSFIWDEDKLLEIINQYVSYLLAHPEDLIEFMEVVLKVDFNKSFISKEEIMDSTFSLYKKWNTEVENNLPKYKEMLKGTRLYFEGKFEEDSFKSNYKLVLKIDKSKKYLFEEDKVEIEELDAIIHLLSYTPYWNLIKEYKDLKDISIEISQKWTKLPNLNISMPKSYEDFDYDEMLQTMKKNY